MATPINTIKKQPLTEEQIIEQNLENLKQLLTENKDTINQLFAIMAELNNIGALEAATKMLEAKEEVAEIALGQFTRKPVTNIINNVMSAAGVLSTIDPETTSKLIEGITTGIDEAKKATKTENKVGLFELLNMLNDSDVNRGIQFGIHFLKGFGKSLK